MPNHITTEIRCEDQRALSSLLNDKGEVDFEFLVSLPANIEKGNCNGQHAPDVLCWYEWQTANWGTKWNAYDSKASRGIVRFDTAWSHPVPIMRALSVKHPTVEFDVKYADEDLGANLGHYRLRNEISTALPIEDSHEFAAQLKYGKSYAEMQKEWS